jgi:serine/threonine protein kinase
MYKVSNCKNCIKIIDYIEKKDRYIIIMERPEHCVDLWDYIYEKGPLNENIARIFFKQILESVLAMKLNGVLHRDIKDENILIDLKNGQIKIVDFGAGTHYTTEDLNDFQGIVPKINKKNKQFQTFFSF